MKLLTFAFLALAAIMILAPVFVAEAATSAGSPAAALSASISIPNGPYTIPGTTPRCQDSCRLGGGPRGPAVEQA